MNTVSQDIAELLESDGSLNLTIGDNLFIGKEPPEPANTVTIYDDSGSPPQKTYKRGEDYYYPSIQLRIRHSQYLKAGELAFDIAKALHRRAHEAINGTYYSAIDCSISPAFFDYDEKDRARWVVSFNVQRRENNN